MKEIVKQELKSLAQSNYWGSKKQIKMERIISQFAFKDLGIEMKYNEAIEEFYSRVAKGYELQENII